jgi:hypothetical protein
MPNPSISLDIRSSSGAPPKLPTELPHGLIEPSQRTLEIVAREKAKFLPDIFTPEAEDRLTNDLTLQETFEGFGYEVAYRITARGPEVLAVGYEEILALARNVSQDERTQIKTWLP